MMPSTSGPVDTTEEQAPRKLSLGLLMIAVTSSLLGSGYLLFRPRASCTVSDDACGDSRRIAQRIYLISGLFVSGLLLFPVIAPIFY